MENTATTNTESTVNTDELINAIATSIQEQLSASSTTTRKRRTAELSYRLLSTPSKLRKGQCTQAFAGLEALGEGTLDEIVDEVIRLHPQYKTKFNLRESVKFHLHCLSREGFVEEVN